MPGPNPVRRPRTPLEDAVLRGHEADSAAHPWALRDAPQDGQLYGRQDGGWVAVPGAGAGGGVSLATVNALIATAIAGHAAEADPHPPYLTAAEGNAAYVSLTGTYSDPPWLSSLAWAKITGTPTTLTGYGITDAQPLDAELSALAGLASAADRVPYFTGSGTAALATLTAFGRSLVDDADAAAGRVTLGAAASGAVTGSGLTVSATDRILGRVTAGSGPIEEITCTPFARSILDDADAAAARTTLNAQVAGSYQAADADLAAIAALSGAGILARTAADTWALRTIAGTTGQITVTNGDGVAGAPTISLPANITSAHTWSAAQVFAAGTETAVAVAIGAADDGFFAATGSIFCSIDGIRALEIDAGAIIAYRTTQTPPADGDFLCALSTGGYDGAAWDTTIARLRIVAAEAWTTTAHGTDMQALVRRSGTTASEWHGWSLYGSDGWIDVGQGLVVGGIGRAAQKWTSSEGVQPQFQVFSNNANGSSLGIARFTADGTGPRLIFNKSRIGTPGTWAGGAVTTGTVLADIIAEGSDGTVPDRAARIVCAVRGTVSAGIVPAGWQFFTKNAAGVLAQRAELYPDGGFQVGGTFGTGPGTGGLSVQGFVVGTPTRVGGFFSGADTPLAQIHGDVPVGIARWSANAFGPVISIAKSRGASVGTQGLLLANDTLGVLAWQGSDGVNLRRAAEIEVQAAGTPAASRVGAYLTIRLAADSASSVPAAVMRLFQDGGVQIGGTFSTTSPGAGVLLCGASTTSTSTTTGAAVVTGGLGVGRSINLGGTSGDFLNIANATGELRVNGTKVVAARRTGWTAQTATASRADLGAAPTVNAIASFLRALYDDLVAHGLIGA